MPSTNAPQDGFERLRDAFVARMTAEQVHYVTARAALSEADADPALIYKGLYERAHRLHGGAVMFNFADVGAAAGLLEAAVLHAADASSDDIQGSVRHALAHLIGLIGRARTSG
jgi:hypothetical protein